MAEPQFTVRVCLEGKDTQTKEDPLCWIYPDFSYQIPSRGHEHLSSWSVNPHLTDDELEEMQNARWRFTSLSLAGLYPTHHDMRSNEAIESIVEDWKSFGTQMTRLLVNHPVAKAHHYADVLKFHGSAGRLRHLDASQLTFLPFHTLSIQVDKGRMKEASDIDEAVDMCARSVGCLVDASSFSSVVFSSNGISVWIAEKWLRGGGCGFSGEVEVIYTPGTNSLDQLNRCTCVLEAIYQQHLALCSNDETKFKGVSVLTIHVSNDKKPDLQFHSTMLSIMSLMPSFQVRIFVSGRKEPVLMSLNASRLAAAFGRELPAQSTPLLLPTSTTTLTSRKEDPNSFLGLRLDSHTVYAQTSVLLQHSKLLRGLLEGSNDNSATNNDKDEDGVPIVPLLMDRPVALHTVQLMVCFLTECVLEAPEAAEVNPANHEGYKRKSRNLALFTDTMLGDSVREKKLNMCELIGLATYLDIDVLKHYARVQFLRLFAC